MTTGADVSAMARTFMDTPWRHQGRLPGIALDCAGLIICTAWALSLLPREFDLNGYSRNPDGSMLDTCHEHLVPIPALEDGAVIVLVTSAEPQHVGIISNYRHGGWSIIHASNAGDRPRVIETRLMINKVMRPVGYFRMPGLES